MGTGARAGRLRPGLPHRRYSVPETVMRKYVLTKARSESSDSGVATVPVPTPDGVSGSEGARRRATSRWSNGGGSGSDRGPPSPRRRAPASHGGSLTALTRIAPGVEPNLLRTLHANERTHGFEPSRTSRGLHPEVTPSHADVSTQLSKTPVLTINTVSDSSGADSPKVQAQNGKTQYLPVNVVHRATPPPPRQFSKSSGPSLSSQSSALSESTSGRVSGSSETAETCSVTPATDLSFSTPTDCCTTPPVSESCSLTTSDSRATTSSMTIDQPVSDHTNSTQDVTLSVPSTHEHTPFSNPLTEGEITSGASSAVQDQYNTDHIAFMDDKEESLPNRRSSLILAMAIVSVREQAEEKSQSETRFCGPSDAPPSQYINMDDVDTNQDSIKNDREENECQLCNYEPDDVKNGGDKQKEPHLVNRLQDGAPDEDTRFETNKTKPNKTLFLEQTDTSLLIPTTPEIEIRHVKTFQVISPNILSVKRNDKCAGTLPTAPPEPNISDTSEVIQEQKVHKLGAEEPQVEVKHLLTGPDVYAPYRWNQQTEEDRQIRQTHQRQRFWIHRRLVSATTLPPTAPTQDPISACAGSSYRRTQEEQLVIPRYSALPRSLSMLVNTSSGDCSSNSDSETLSLADSLEDGQSFSKTGGSKYDNKPVRGDIVKLLPEGNTQWQHKRIHVATPRGKGKAFFVSISQGNYDDQEDQQLSRSMPDKLKDKLSQRQRQMQLKKQKRQESDSTKNGNSPTSPVSPTPENRPSSRPETPQKKSQQSVSTQTVQEPKVQIPQQSNAVEEPSTDNIVVIKEPIPTVTITNHDQDGAPETNPEHILRPITPLHSDKISDTTLVKQPVDNTEERKPLKSSIPIKKSPISLRKLTPPVMSPTILQNLNQKPSQLPIRRPIRSIQQSPPVRRSANLLGNRFHQQFEVIPEERSGSLESSAEDQGRVRRASLPIGSSKHYCGIVDRSEQSHLYSVKNKSKPNSVANDDTSSNNDDNIPDGISARCGQAKSSRPLVRRPGRQSKTARAPRERPKERDDSTSTYKGKAALAPHEEDKDLLSLSKGWINFYLLKNSRGTPEDSTAEDASTNISEKDERVRRRPGPPIRTVTVVGAEEDRLRQFSVHTRNGTALPELKSNVSSRRASLAESEPSTLYLQLPSPRLSMPGLLEGSGELACSESSSVSTSSDSEPDRMPSPALLPVRWAGRQSRRGPRQRSRSHGPGVATSGGGWTVTMVGSISCPLQANVSHVF